MAFDPLYDESGDVSWRRSLTDLADQSVRRGYHLRRRRRLIVSGASGSVALAVLALLIGVLGIGPGANRGQGVRTINQPDGRVITTPSLVPSPAPPDAGAAAPGQPAADPSTVPNDSTGSPADQAYSAQSGGDGSYPAMSSCSVNNAGAAPDELRTCRFIATTAGGWGGGYTSPVPGPPVGGFALDDAHSSVVVTRNGVSTAYHTGSNDVGCANAIIEPGDLVEVQLRAASQSTGPPSPYRAGAGDGWGC